MQTIERNIGTLRAVLAMIERRGEIACDDVTDIMQTEHGAALTEFRSGWTGAVRIECGGAMGQGADRDDALTKWVMHARYRIELYERNTPMELVP